MLHKLASGRYVSDELLKGVLGVAAEYGFEATKMEVAVMRDTILATTEPHQRRGVLRIIANPGVTFEYDRYEDAVRDLKDVLRLCGVKHPDGLAWQVWLNKEPVTKTVIFADSEEEAAIKFRAICGIAGFSADGEVSYRPGITPAMLRGD